MALELKENKRKKRSMKRFFQSFQNSIAGLKNAYKNEQSMTLHFFSCLIVVILGIFYHMSPIEWAVSILLLGMIAATELINTALEAVVDLVTQKIHPLAKIAKDTASGAVFIFSLVAFICFLIIFLPKMLGIGV